MLVPGPPSPAPASLVRWHATSGCVTRAKFLLMRFASWWARTTYLLSGRCLSSESWDADGFGMTKVQSTVPGPVIQFVVEKTPMCASVHSLSFFVGTSPHWQNHNFYMFNHSFLAKTSKPFSATISFVPLRCSIHADIDVGVRASIKNLQVFSRPYKIQVVHCFPPRFHGVVEHLLGVFPVMRPVHGVHHSGGGEMPRVPSEDVQVDRRTEGERQTTGTVLVSALGNDVTGIFLEQKL